GNDMGRHCQNAVRKEHSMRQALSTVHSKLRIGRLRLPPFIHPHQGTHSLKRVNPAFARIGFISPRICLSGGRYYLPKVSQYCLATNPATFMTPY
ncbi:hypothetical protein Tcan_02327, partial [Toxocara canis]